MAILWAEDQPQLKERRADQVWQLVEFQKLLSCPTWTSKRSSRKKSSLADLVLALPQTNWVQMLMVLRLDPRPGLFPTYQLMGLNQTSGSQTAPSLAKIRLCPSTTTFLPLATTRLFSQKVLDSRNTQLLPSLLENVDFLFLPWPKSVGSVAPRHVGHTISSHNPLPQGDPMQFCCPW